MSAPRVLVPFRGRFIGCRVHVDQIGAHHVIGTVYTDRGREYVFIDRACFAQDLGPSDDARDRSIRDRQRAERLSTTSGGLAQIAEFVTSGSG